MPSAIYSLSLRRFNGFSILGCGIAHADSCRHIYVKNRVVSERTQQSSQRMESVLRHPYRLCYCLFGSNGLLNRSRVGSDKLVPLFRVLDAGCVMPQEMAKDIVDAVRAYKRHVQNASVNGAFKSLNDTVVGFRELTQEQKDEARQLVFSVL